MSDFDAFNFGTFDIDSSDLPVIEPSPSTTEVEPFRVERRLSDDRAVEYTESLIPGAVKPQFDEAWAIHLALCESEAYAANADTFIAKKELEYLALQESIKDQLKAIRDDISTLKAEKYDHQVMARKLSMKYYSVMRQLRLAMENYKQQQEYLDASELFDRDTANAPWREWALPHQLEGAKILAAQGSGILADKMGLGKTLTSLMFADMVKSKRLLVVVPADVIRNYEREIQRWTPHRQVFPFGRLPKAQRSFVLNLLSGMDEFVVTVNYEAWRRDTTMINALIDLRFDTVILDEAHVMKTNSGTAAKGVTDIVMADNVCPQCNSRTAETIVGQTRYGNNIRRTECDVCEWNSQEHGNNYEYGARRSVKHVLPMTGTPILNKPEDLFPLLHLIRPQDFASAKDFREDFLTTDYDGKYVFRTGGMESLAIRLGSSMVSRDKQSAGVILPKQTIQVHDIDFDKENYSKQWKVISDLSKHAGIILESGENLSILAQIALITRQRQANVWPAGIEVKDPVTGEVVFSVGSEVKQSLKLDMIEGLIDDYVSDERIVIFSQFKTPLRELERRLIEKGVRVACFDGDTPEHVRESIKIDFDRKYTVNGQHKYDVVLCNYKTGGVGLNFTNATQMIIMDEEWNPGKRDQAYARMDRVGQTEETTVHVLRINNTVDTWLATLIGEKEDMINGFQAETDLRQAYIMALKNGEA